MPFHESLELELPSSAAPRRGATQGRGLAHEIPLRAVAGWRTIAGVLSAAALLLAACSAQVQRPVFALVTGFASSPATLSGFVSLKDSSTDGTEISTRTDTAGAFSIDVKGLTPPFLLRTDVTDGSSTARLHAVSTGAVNVNPITDVVVVGAAGVADPDVLYAQRDPDQIRAVAERAGGVAAELATVLAPLYRLYGVSDPVDDTSPAGAAALRAMLTDVAFDVTGAGTLVVTNLATSAVIYDGPSATPSTGTFRAANLPGTPSPPPPLCTYTYSDWGVCEPSGTQARAVSAATPAGCVGTPDLTQGCTYVDPAPPACSYTYSDWGACAPSGTQARTVATAMPAGCAGTPELIQGCTYVDPTPAPTTSPPPPPSPCTYVYSGWGACQSNGSQSRTVTSVTPAGCAGTPALTQSCTYVPPPARVYPPQVSIARYSMPALRQPAMGASVTNVFVASAPEMNTTTTRATASVNSYPKNSAWNEDESLLVTWDYNVYDGTTYAFVRNARGSVAPNEGRNWANSDRRYIYGVHAQNKQWIRVDATNPANNVVLHTFTASELGVASLGAISYGLYEGNFDDGDRFVNLIACTGTGYCGTPHVPFLADVKTGRFLRKLTGRTYSTIYDTTVSHDGAYALVTYPGSVGPTVDVFSTATGAFLRTLNTTHEMPHWDACVDSNGDQVAVGLEYMYRMSDGRVTALYPEWLPHHVSCRNSKRPGYAYYALSNVACGTGTADPAQTNAFHKVFALKLDGSQRIENFAWDHQPCPQGTTAALKYARFPAAVPSRWGDRVFFRSTWDVTDGTVNGYVAHK